jgi:hypothetical protein
VGKLENGKKLLNQILDVDPLHRRTPPPLLHLKKVMGKNRSRSGHGSLTLTIPSLRKVTPVQALPALYLQIRRSNFGGGGVM